MIPRFKCWLFGHDIEMNNVKQYRASFVVNDESTSEWFSFLHYCKRCNTYINWEKRQLMKTTAKIDGKYYHDEEWVE